MADPGRLQRRGVFTWLLSAPTGRQRLQLWKITFAELDAPGLTPFVVALMIRPLIVSEEN